MEIIQAVVMIIFMAIQAIFNIQLCATLDCYLRRIEDLELRK